MLRPRCGLLAVVAVLSASGCALPFSRGAGIGSPLILASYETPAQAKSDDADRVTIHVVGHGWHTGIVLPTRAIATDRWPEADHFQELDFIEVGWGDEGFYRAKKITAALVAKAAFWPTPSVIHVAGAQGNVEEFYQVSDIIEVRLPRTEFDNLCRFIADAFDRDEHGYPHDLGPGLYGQSRFFRARGKYYLPKTCNVWTARALKSAGCPTLAPLALNAENLLFQTRQFGTVVQESPSGLKQAALSGSE